MKEYSFLIDEEWEGERLDRALSGLIPELSRSYIQKFVKDGQVFVNGTAKKASYNLVSKDEIRFELPEMVAPDINPEDIPLEILFEDDQVIVVNKPKGMVVHPANGHYSGTLVNALLFHCKDLSGINGVLRPGIVHRIDKDTTGSVIACKNDTSHNCIASQLKEHSVKRKYRAICIGNLSEDSLTIDAPIGRDDKDRKKMAIKQNGKRAVTHVKVLEHFKGFTYIECELETGRTHQIRVHMSSIRHPLLGDVTYGGERKDYKLEGQCLHAHILGFVHPVTGDYIETVAPIPKYFEDLLTRMRKL